MQATALLVIDVQQSFEHMPFWSDEGLSIYQQKQNSLIAHARSESWPVIFVYHQSRGPFSRESGLVEPMGWIDRQAGDAVFYKRVHNALSDSGLEPYLAGQGISRLLISGIRTEQCCETTARAASDIGYEVDYVVDATHTFPMALASGVEVSSDMIKEHTAMVLQGRFACVRQVAELIDSPKVLSVNSRCPRSGQPVSEGALTEYRGHTVGFCNQGCRDSFARDPNSHAMDCLYFDRLIAKQSVGKAYL